MQRTFGAVVALWGLVASAGGRAEAGILVPGSTFIVRLADTSGDGSATSTITVNGQPQSFSYHNVTITVTEAEANRGGGNHQITVNFSASQDIFPTPGSGQGQIGFVSIGGSSDPMKLTRPFDLTSVPLTYTNGTGGVIVSAEAIEVVAHPAPWNGFFPASSAIAGIAGTTGVGVQGIQIQLSGHVTPEPSTLVLAGIGALALAGYAWRRRRVRA